MKFIPLVFLFLFAQTVSAQVFISEIMYDPEGADTGHEWVEIVNQGSAPVDLVSSKFVEEGSNHGLSVVQGATELVVGAYAIIADNAQTFLTDHAGFSGIVLDSSFSLKNTGESISFKMPDSTISDTVSYASDMGGAGDGNSLQKIDGAWRAGAPTPNIANVSNQEVIVPSSDTQTVVSSTTSSVSDTSSHFDTLMYTRITIKSGGSVNGAPIIFSGEAVDSKKKPIDNAYYSWTFGDGETGSGKIVSHIFRYTGDYIVVLDVSPGYGIPGVSTRLKILVSPAFLRASPHDAISSAVDIINEGTKDVDLSSWVIEGDSRRFTFPEHTMLLAGATITLAPETTGFRNQPTFLKILYPNWQPYEYPQKVTAALVQKENSIPEELKTTPAAPQPIAKSLVASYKQTASVADSFIPPSQTTSTVVEEQNKEEGSLWPWYTGAAFLGAFALLGIRLTQDKDVEHSSELTADDFEIIEDNNDEEPH